MERPPWVSIVHDDCGIATVHVKEDDLSDFPKFMHFALKEKIGMDKGVLKVIIKDNVPHTSLEDLLCHAHKFYTTKVHRGKKMQAPQLIQQSFFYGSHSDHLYGYREAVKDQKCNVRKAKVAFTKKLEDPTNFINQSTCCLQALSVSEDQLLDHYWQVIRSLSSSSCGLESSVETGDAKGGLDKAVDARRRYYPYKVATYPEAACNVEVDYEPPRFDLQWDKDGKDPIFYAAGIPMKGVNFFITSDFSLSTLHTILDEYPVETPGISYPYLYIGFTHASFPWHIEDGALFSINYLHYGAPCVWFFVPPQYYKKFLDCAPFFPLDLCQVSCFNVFGHKYLMASKEFLQKMGIPVHIVIQREKELVITYPYAAHSGFKTGCNVQEAANFADPWWVEPGILAPTCDCFPNQSIKTDLREMVAVACPNLYCLYVQQDIPGLFKAIAGNEFIQQLGLLPSPPGHGVTRGLQSVEGARMSSRKGRDKKMDDGKKTEEVAESREQEFKGARCDLRCPVQKCVKTFHGGRAKLKRLLDHIEMQHPGQPELLSKVNAMYPPKKKNPNGLSCSICGEWKSGGLFHLRLHISRKHSAEHARGTKQ